MAGLGILRDLDQKQGIPSRLTILTTVVAGIALEFYARMRGVRALRISSQGITVERALGGSTLRLSWADLASVEVSSRGKGATWTFVTRTGKRVQWAQDGNQGDERLELEKALVGALQQHGVPLKGRSSAN